MSADGLYRRILGPAWDDLDASVQRAHLVEPAPVASGSLRVWNRPGRWTRRILRAMGVPADGEAVPVRLVVEPRGDRERYRRSFGGAPLVSFQTRAGPGLMDERFGVFGVRFRLTVEDRALVYRQIGAAVWLGSLRVPLPLSLAPRARAREDGDGPDRTRLLVEVSGPGVGRLFSYEGRLAWEDGVA